MSKKNIMEMSKDEYMVYMGERLAVARQKRRERHRAFMDGYMEWRRGPGVSLTSVELETLIGYLGSILENDPNDAIQTIYTKLVNTNKKDGNK
jgi:hypothetical protein